MAERRKGSERSEGSRPPGGLPHRVLDHLPTLVSYVDSDCRYRYVNRAYEAWFGVSLAEIDSRTMESKLVPGLYFAGEILDLDGPIGGYNFQAAFSTGVLAGRSV